MNFTAQQALPCSLDVAKYFSCQGYNQNIHINQQLTRTSSLSANGYESAACNQHGVRPVSRHRLEFRYGWQLFVRDRPIKRSPRRGKTASLSAIVAACKSQKLNKRESSDDPTKRPGSSSRASCSHSSDRTDQFPSRNDFSLSDRLG